ncbi:MAG: nicotinate-nucleotide adenylyltransferase, partial [Acidimicrobiia bacterium]|nr:nicotinate-nucleotide adenylyltransferase [Acidimicrobiia bacterium]
AAREPGVDWRIIVGADAAAGLDTWHRADELRAKHRFVMVNRPGASPTPPPGWDCELVGIPALDISSTELRRLVAEGRSVRHLVPSGVVQRLERWGLYRRGS